MASTESSKKQPSALPLSVKEEEETSCSKKRLHSPMKPLATTTTTEKRTRVISPLKPVAGAQPPPRRMSTRQSSVTQLASTGPENPWKATKKASVEPGGDKQPLKTITNKRGEASDSRRGQKK